LKDAEHKQFQREKDVIKTAEEENKRKDNARLKEKEDSE
jgi:hypothetical protein